MPPCFQHQIDQRVGNDVNFGRFLLVPRSAPPSRPQADIAQQCPLSRVLPTRFNRLVRQPFSVCQYGSSFHRIPSFFLNIVSIWQAARHPCWFAMRRTPPMNHNRFPSPARPLGFCILGNAAKYRFRVFVTAMIAIENRRYDRYRHDFATTMCHSPARSITCRSAPQCRQRWIVLDFSVNLNRFVQRTRFD